nr:acryloyl-CoA reductase [Kineosphaera limosa]
MRAVPGAEPKTVAVEFADVPVADLGSGEVLLRTTYSSLNYKDALAITGAGRIARRLPLVLGVDAVGEVIESRSARVPVGSRVVVACFGMSEDHDGGLATHARVPADWAIPVPAGLSDEQAALLGTAGLTSALAIHRLEHNGLVPGAGPVAVTGASGGAGSFAVAMLARLGYEVVAFSGKPEAADYLRALGASEVRPRPDTSSTKPLESQMWAGAVDCVGGEPLAWLIRTMKYGASVAAFGNAAGHELDTTVFPFILRGVNLLGVNAGWFDLDLRRDLWRRLGDDLRLTDEQFASMCEVVPFRDVEAAARRVLDGSVRGRLVVDLSG